jgi:hypothetical protein
MQNLHGNCNWSRLRFAGGNTPVATCSAVSLTTSVTRRDVTRCDAKWQPADGLLTARQNGTLLLQLFVWEWRSANHGAATLVRLFRERTSWAWRCVLIGEMEVCRAESYFSCALVLGKNVLSTALNLICACWRNGGLQSRKQFLY